MTKHRFVFLAIAATFVLAGCGEGAPESPKLNTAHADAKPSPPQEGNAEQASGESLDQTPVAPPTTPKHDLKALSADCGYDLEETQTPFATMSLTGLKQVIKGSGNGPIFGFPKAFEAHVATTLTLAGSPEVVRLTTASTLTSVNPESGRKAAESSAKAMSGIIEGRLATANPDLFLESRLGSFATVVCGVHPASSLAVTSSAGAIDVAFATPLAWQINPTVPAAQLAREIGEGLVFQPVVATVTRSTDAGVKAGTTFTVEVRVQPAQTPATFDVSGESVTIGGDFAYGISYLSSNAEIAERLGLFGTRTFYLVDEVKPLKALQITAGLSHSLFVRQ